MRWVQHLDRTREERGENFTAKVGSGGRQQRKTKTPHRNKKSRKGVKRKGGFLGRKAGGQAAKRKGGSITFFREGRRGE